MDFFYSICLQTFMSRLKKAGNSVHSDLSVATTSKATPEATAEEADPEKYHVTAAGRKFLVEQGLGQLIYISSVSLYPIFPEFSPGTSR